MACNPFERFERFHNGQQYYYLGTLIKEHYRHNCFEVNFETRTIKDWNPDFGSFRWNQATNETEETPYEESTRTFYDFYLDFFKKDIELALKCVQENAAKGRFDFTEGCIKSFFHSIFRWNTSESYPDYYNSVLWIIGKVSAEAYHYSESPLVRDITNSIIGRLSDRGVKVKFEPVYERSVELPPQQESGTQGYGVKLKPGKTVENFMQKLIDHNLIDTDTELESFEKIILSTEIVPEEHKITWVHKSIRNKELTVQSLIYLIHKMTLPSESAKGLYATTAEIKKISNFFKGDGKDLKIKTYHLRNYKSNSKKEYKNVIDKIIEEFVDLQHKLT